MDDRLVRVHVRVRRPSRDGPTGENRLRRATSDAGAAGAYHACAWWDVDSGAGVARTVCVRGDVSDLPHGRIAYRSRVREVVAGKATVGALRLRVAEHAEERPGNVDSRGRSRCRRVPPQDEHDAGG